MSIILLFTDFQSPDKYTTGVRIKGLFWSPLEPTTETCFSPLSFDWFHRKISEVLNFGLYLKSTVAMVTKMADQIGLKQRNYYLGQI